MLGQRVCRQWWPPPGPPWLPAGWFVALTFGCGEASVDKASPGSFDSDTSYHDSATCTETNCIPADAGRAGEYYCDECGQSWYASRCTMDCSDCDQNDVFWVRHTLPCDCIDADGDNIESEECYGYEWE